MSKAGTEVKENFMKPWKNRKYIYAILVLCLVLAVGLTAIFSTDKAPGISSGARPRETLAPQPFPTPGKAEAPAVTPAPAEELLEILKGTDSEPKELAGVWVPYMSLTVGEHTEEAFQDNFRAIADSAREKGLNALFVHVRPFCDALYPSKLYPWSHILTGEQGKDPGFDPLEFMVEYTHSLGMQFHAWINPLRVKTEHSPETLSADNPYEQLREDSPYYFMEYQGGIYLDPAYSYVRTLIAEGAAEIVSNYKVDGIHFDDYFYPAEDESLDSEAYSLYVSSVETPLSLLEWRKANINAMVQEVYEAVKQADGRALFGISPQGNLGNDERMGADVKTWCAIEGYVDYICPQLYYSFENPALGYSEALEEWTALSRHDGLRLYVGLALYKAGSDADEGTWQLSDDIISRQIEEARAAQCSGIVLYSSDYLDAGQTEREVENAVALLT